MSTRLSAAIYGLAGHELNEEEKNFFSQQLPVGYILFARNCRDPQQLAALCASLRALSGEDTLILIDQEGGRVARLKPPHWRLPPAAALFAGLAEQAGLEEASRAVYANTRLIAHELHALGINVDCAPLADVPVRGAHDIIGDRAFGTAPEQVAALGRAMANGLLEGGVLPVLKHIPGHGRAGADSHEELPRVDSSLDELRRTDFVPFRELNDLPLGMTAHVLYSAIDDAQPATLSAKVLGLVREEIGFDGLLMSDDLSMKALKGTFEARARLSLDAGCDIVLHCNGSMDEMRQVAQGVRMLDDAGERRLAAAKALWQRMPAAFDLASARAFVDGIAERHAVAG